MYKGIIEKYRDYLPVSKKTPVITLLEGNTPLVRAKNLEEKLKFKGSIYLKYEGMNPTGSFKDRGMTVAISKAVEENSRAVICASTGNTSASAAAYAARAKIRCVVLIPEGAIALGKLSQALVHGADVFAVKGNFDDALKIVKDLSEKHPITLVNSLNPYRIEGQKTAAFEIIEALGRAPDYQFMPVGNAGNITAYWKGYKEFRFAGFQADASASEVQSSKKFKVQSSKFIAKTLRTPNSELKTILPKMMGFQAAGAAPLVLGKPVKDPKTVATAIKIGNPASWQGALAARDESGGVIDTVTDAEIIAAYKLLASTEGIFCEPASAASVAGLIKYVRNGFFSQSSNLPNFRSPDVVCILTGHGLKDPDCAMKNIRKPKVVACDVSKIAKEIGL